MAFNSRGTLPPPSTSTHRLSITFNLRTTPWITLVSSVPSCYLPPRFGCSSPTIWVFFLLRLLSLNHNYPISLLEKKSMSNQVNTFQNPSQTFIRHLLLLSVEKDDHPICYYYPIVKAIAKMMGTGI